MLSPGMSPEQPLPGIRLHDPLHGRQACPEFNLFRQGVGQICPRKGIFRAVPSQNGDKFALPPPLFVQRLKGASSLKNRAASAAAVGNFVLSTARNSKMLNTAPPPCTSRPHALSSALSTRTAALKARNGRLSHQNHSGGRSSV